MTQDGGKPAGPVADVPAAAVTRKTLGREQILREAVRFIDEHGRERLTMRRLGAELGVEAMALYRYVPGRDQLLDGVVEYVMNELYESTMRDELTDSWQEYLQKMAHGVRRVSTKHPRIFPLVATRPPAAPWLRPPLRSLRWVESFLQGLREYGFSPRVSVAVYRSFATFLLGSLLLEAGTLEDPTITEKVNLAFIESDDLSSYPIISEMSDELKDGGFEV